MRELSHAARRELFCRESGEVISPLITITHPDLASPIRVVGDTVDLTRHDETYQAVPFTFEMPADEEGRIQTVRIQMSNVHRSLVDLLRSIATAPTVTFELVRVSDPTDVLAGPWDLVVTDVPYNASVIELELGRSHSVEVDWPTANHAVLPQHFPGLFG